MLAATKSDLGAHVPDRLVEQRSQAGRSDLGGIETEEGQQTSNQVALVLPQLVSLAPPKERALWAIAINRAAKRGRIIA
jgi:hypothetical protein